MAQNHSKDFSIRPIDGEDISDHLKSDDPAKFLSAYHTLTKRWDGAVPFQCMMDMNTYRDFESYAEVKGIDFPETFRRAITALYREEIQ